MQPRKLLPALFGIWMAIFLKCVALAWHGWAKPVAKIASESKQADALPMRGYPNCELLPATLFRLKEWPSLFRRSQNTLRGSPGMIDISASDGPEPPVHRH